MNKRSLDSIDNKIIRLLDEDGRMPIGDMAKRLHITAPTVRTRIKNLEEEGLLKVSGLVDPDRHPKITTAIVAMSIRSHGKMDQILKKIADLGNVAWASVVTGRYDIVAEVVFKGGTEELYQFTTETILKMANVLRSETFVVMKSRKNWVRLPEGVKDI
jgi:Lrp/AsnC family transcriptional regulator for asnA, asnC and gidA